MLNITDNEQEQKIPAFFRLGFRPLFMSAGIFAFVAIIFWVGALSGHFSFAPVNGALWWHAHEMIFGFTCAVIVGFLLTAVQTWTGQNGVKGWSLFGLWLLWFVARLLLLMNVDWLSKEVVIAIDLAFLPVSAFFLAQPILRVKQYRNLFFVPVLLLLTFCNLIMHINPFDGGITHGGYSAILFITLIMTVMGGRVIPFFTANACKFQKPVPIAYLEVISLISVWFIAFGFLLNLHSLDAFDRTFAILCLVAGVSNFIKMVRWKFTKTLLTPLLWSLHIAYFFIPMSFILLAWHFATGQFSIAGVLHGLTVGAMGNMILSMMARVSLGHSGRPLTLHSLVPSAFLALIFSACVRIIGVALQTDSYLLTVVTSAIFWCYGFIVFSLVYWPLLTKPRVDGRPG